MGRKKIPRTTKQKAAQFKKGRPKTGGRKKGSNNKNPGLKRSWKSAQQVCEDNNFDPFELLMAFATNNIKTLKLKEDIKPELRVRALEACAKHVHPTLKAHQLQTDEGEDFIKAFARAVTGE